MNYNCLSHVQNTGLKPSLPPDPQTTLPEFILQTSQDGQVPPARRLPPLGPGRACSLLTFPLTNEDVTCSDPSRGLDVPGFPCPQQ